MNITKIGGKKGVLELEFTGVSPAFMNAIRRLIINEVPTMAIELCEIRKNSSIMYDEVLASRLGLLPLTTDLKSYTLPGDDEKKNNDYTAKSSVKGILVAKGPCTVYAKEIKFKDPKIKPVYPDTPILKLLEGQEIELEVTAVMGQGKEHSKWSPGTAYYHEVPKEAPVADERGARKKGHDSEPETGSGHYYFKVESWGQLKPKEILEEAANQFQKLLKEFGSQI